MAAHVHTHIFRDMSARCNNIDMQQHAKMGDETEDQLLREIVRTNRDTNTLTDVCVFVSVRQESGLRTVQREDNRRGGRMDSFSLTDRQSQKTDKRRHAMHTD